MGMKTQMYDKNFTLINLSTVMFNAMIFHAEVLLVKTLISILIYPSRWTSYRIGLSDLLSAMGYISHNWYTYY